MTASVDPAGAEPSVSAASSKATDPPRTGLADVDRALETLTGLDEHPVSEHPDQLATVHETLHRALESPRGSDDA